MSDTNTTNTNTNTNETTNIPKASKTSETSEISKKTVNNLVIEGGGVKGIAFVGAIKALEEKTEKEEILQYTGARGNGTVKFADVLGDKLKAMGENKLAEKAPEEKKEKSAPPPVEAAQQTEPEKEEEEIPAEATSAPPEEEKDKE